MALADDIAALRDRALADLAAEHDYFLDARVAWRIVRNGIAGGQTTRYRNWATGNITGAAELLKKSRQYVRVRLVQATFQQFISIFENFFFDLLRLWLTAYPQSLAGRKVDFKAILEAPDKEAIVLLAIEREVGEILYDRPANWFAYLEDRVKLGCPTPDETAGSRGQGVPRRLGAQQRCRRQYLRSESRSVRSVRRRSANRGAVAIIVRTW